MDNDFYLDKAMCTCIGYIPEDEHVFACTHLRDLKCTFFTEPKCEYVVFYNKPFTYASQL